MLHATLLVFIAYLSVGSTQNVESKIVTITQGPVRGYKAPNSDVFEFFGIPYATVPSGVDKFKAPLEAPTWTGTFEAIDNNIGCPQNNDWFGGAGRDDCLVANVYVPTTQETNLPVVVYIHGGAYAAGAGALGSPTPLVESQKIVAVTFNYRLGVHGFLCLGTEDIPGNAGLKDMVAALRWVKDNIASFGGNPNDVTLAGYSAGSSAAEILGLSKTAEGLFHKLILESGTALAWGVQTDPIKNAQDYARRLNFTNVGNLNALEEFYMTISYNELLPDEIALENYDSNLIFVPCVEKYLEQDSVLNDSPVNIIRNGTYTKLPILFGFANMEGMFRMPQFDSWAPRMNERFSDFLLAELGFETDDQKESVSEAVKEFYFGSNTVGLFTLFNYIDYFGDSMFAYPTLRSIKLRLETTGDEPIYLYEYTFYERFNSVPGVPDVLVNFPGAGHTYQTEAILSLPSQFSEDNLTERYQLLRAQVREIWINFITTGMPVPEDSSFPSWPPTNANRSPYMIIGDTIELGEALNTDRVQFWDDIYEQYYRQPLPPVFVESEYVPDNASMLSGSIVLNVLLLYLTLILLST